MLCREKDTHLTKKLLAADLQLLQDALRINII